MTASQISESRQPSWRILEGRPWRRALIYDSDPARSTTWTSLLLTDPFPDLVQRDHRECWIMYWYIFSDIFEVIRHIQTEDLIHVAAMIKPYHQDTEWVTGWRLNRFKTIDFDIIHIKDFWTLTGMSNFEESLYSLPVVKRDRVVTVRGVAYLLCDSDLACLSQASALYHDWNKVLGGLPQCNLNPNYTHLRYIQNKSKVITCTQMHSDPSCCNSLKSAGQRSSRTVSVIDTVHFTHDCGSGEWDECVCKI